MRRGGPVHYPDAPPVTIPAPPPRRSLFDRDWQKALTILLTLLAAAALLWVFWLIITPILRIIALFVLAAVVAFALAGPVDVLANRIGSRAAAIAVVYLVVGGVVIGGLFLLAGPFVGQASALINDLPRYASELQAQAPQVQSTLGQYGVQTNFDAIKSNLVGAIQQAGGDVLTGLLGTAAEIGGLMVDAVLALVISFYFLLDGPTARDRLLRIIPPEHHTRAEFFEANASRVLGGYLRGQLILALIIGVAAGAGTALLGLPYAIVLGVLAGLFELVPMFGPFLSAIPAVIVALFQPFPTVVWVIVLFVVIQQVENNLLVPRISGHAVGLHPVGAIFALLTGFTLFGVLGALFAVPIAGIVWVLIEAAYRETVVEPAPPRRWTLPSFRRPGPGRAA